MIVDYIGLPDLGYIATQRENAGQPEALYLHILHHMATSGLARLPAFLDSSRSLSFWHS